MDVIKSFWSQRNLKYWLGVAVGFMPSIPVYYEKNEMKKFIESIRTIHIDEEIPETNFCSEFKKMQNKLMPLSEIIEKEINEEEQGVDKNGVLLRVFFVRTNFSNHTGNDKKIVEKILECICNTQIFLP